MANAEESEIFSKRPTLRQLEIFVSVIEHGSFAEAGRFLGVTPSAVLQQARLLESLVDS